MRETACLIRMPLLLLVIGLSLSMSSCRNSTPKLETKQPTKLQVGNPGVEPTEVWHTYPWVIVSIEEYKKSCQ